MRTWPGIVPEGSLGKRATVLRLVSAQHRDGHEDTPHVSCSHSLALCKPRSTGSLPQLCQAFGEGACAQPHRSTFAQKE